MMSGSIGRSRSNGPPGAARIMKKVRVMMMNTVGMALASLLSV